MPRSAQKKTKKPRKDGSTPQRDPSERVEELFDRIERGVKPLPAAEELDRLQPALQRSALLDSVRDDVRDFCLDALEESRLEGENLRAWLTLVGGFALVEHGDTVAGIMLRDGLHAPVRIHACRIAAALGGSALEALPAVLLSDTDTQVRRAAAETLGETASSTYRPVLEALLEEDLPAELWRAVSGALERLPQ
jgi:hypothetical protein